MKDAQTDDRVGDLLEVMGTVTREQLADAGFVSSSADGANEQPIGPQRATNVVFDVDQLALQELPVGQKRAHLLHVDVLDMDSPVIG